MLVAKKPPEVTMAIESALGDIVVLIYLDIDQLCIRFWKTIVVAHHER